MSGIERGVLQQVVEVTTEPLVIVRVDHPDWPVVLANRAFAAISGGQDDGLAFADIIERLFGRDLAVEIAEAVRAGQETSFPVEHGSREYLLALKPLEPVADSESRYYAAFWRAGTAGVGGDDVHHALLKAKRRIRDLTRDDPVTGLLNSRAFREVLAHDWAVAAREKTALAIVVFSLDDFDAYVDVFGRHAADSCLRRVGQAIRRCLRRASDVVGRVDGATLVALSHAADEANVREFAVRISAAVRELGLHHPRSSVAKFVTVSYEVGMSVDAGDRSAVRYLDSLVERLSG